MLVRFLASFILIAALLISPNISRAGILESVLETFGFGNDAKCDKFTISGVEYFYLTENMQLLGQSEHTARLKHDSKIQMPDLPEFARQKKFLLMNFHELKPGVPKDLGYAEYFAFGKLAPLDRYRILAEGAEEKFRKLLADPKNDNKPLVLFDLMQDTAINKGMGVLPRDGKVFIYFSIDLEQRGGVYINSVTAFISPPGMNFGIQISHHGNHRDLVDFLQHFTEIIDSFLSDLFNSNEECQAAAEKEELKDG